MIDGSGAVVGTVDFEGNVSRENHKIGYALYDMYVYDNDFEAIGYILKDGTVLSFINQNLGTLSKGFLINKTAKLPAAATEILHSRRQQLDSRRIIPERRIA